MRTDSFRLGAMAAAVAAAFGAAPAFGAEGDDEARALSKPESEVALGAGYVSEDNRRFGQYNGLHEKGGYLLLDADIVRRDDRTGKRTASRLVDAAHRQTLTLRQLPLSRIIRRPHEATVNQETGRGQPLSPKFSTSSSFPPSLVIPAPLLVTPTKVGVQLWEVAK